MNMPYSATLVCAGADVGKENNGGVISMVIHFYLQSGVAQEIIISIMCQLGRKLTVNTYRQYE